jgi:2-polyprenyl-3-methyl-5-hydroxy-6-metoxy-1,4-benzoquinol methylase
MGRMTRPRWFTDHDEGHSEEYVQRFRRLQDEGADLGGEARLLDALVAPRSRLLDAGCGPGRTGAELAARGHSVVGVDVDPHLIEAARTDHPGPTWVTADLSTLDLGERFDGAVLAGNVLLFVASDTEAAVITRVAAHVRTDGVVAIGFGLGRGYDLVDFDAHCVAAGLHLEHRFATWDLRPFDSGADFAVSVLRKQ